MTPEENRKESKHNIEKKALVKEIISIVVPVAIVIFIFKYIILIAAVRSGSMEPTLMTGNTVFYNQLAYMRNDIQRGDIIIFWSDEYNKYFGKRVIGLPNETIEFQNGYVIVNGQYLDESEYIPNFCETICPYSFKIPDGCYFLLGDNREYSVDARFWDNPYIPKTKIKGKYIGQINFSLRLDVFNKLRRKKVPNP